MEKHSVIIFTAQREIWHPCSPMTRCDSSSLIAGHYFILFQNNLSSQKYKYHTKQTWFSLTIVSLNCLFFEIQLFCFSIFIFFPLSCERTRVGQCVTLIDFLLFSFSYLPFVWIHRVNKHHLVPGLSLSLAQYTKSQGALMLL